MKVKAIIGAGAAVAIALGVVLLQAKEASVGSAAPAFELTDTKGKKHSLADYKGRFVVLEWINHGCPYVKKHYESGNMQNLQTWAAKKDVAWLSVCTSAEGKQGHMSSAEWNETLKATKSAPLAVLLDVDGKTGKAYGAKTTPHMYVISPEGTLIYKGAIDDKPTYKQEDVPGAKNYVRAALDEAMAGKPVSTASTQPYGCSVKY